MRVQMYGGTDIGLVRSSNQDAIFFNSDYGIAIVSDGMGGHRGGEIASELVVTGLRDAFLSCSQILVEDIRGFLDEVLGRINADILDRSRRDEKLRGMGATVNYLMLAGGHIAIGHAGDSRTYLVRCGKRADGSKWHGIWCLTVDHNVGTFIDRGIFKEGRDYRAGHVDERFRSRLTRGMGVVADLHADLYSRKIEECDVYLTCSDGLHGFCTDSEILRALVSGPLAKSPTRLIELAKSKGAPDNVTIVVTAVGDTDEPFLQPSVPALEKRHYLARTPDGEVVGPLTPSEIIHQWHAENLPSATEVCSSLDEWAFLTDKKSLMSRYPEFNLPKWVERMKAIQSERSSQIGDSYGGYEVKSRSKAGFFIAVAVLFLAIAYFLMTFSSGENI